MNNSDIETISQFCGAGVKSLRPLTGGCVAKVYQVALDNGQLRVAKTCPDGGNLTIEAEMLAYLHTHTKLPVPQVLLASPRLLLMDLIPGDTTQSPSSQADAAHHIAALHSITTSHFGFDFNTLIGPLDQPNPKSERWIPFFRDHRLLYMAGLAEQASRLPTAILKRLEKLAARLEDYLIEPDQPRLIHGDLWAGNILCFDNKISGFIDPAIYFAHVEIELAYTTLFSTFSDRFFDIYQEQRPIDPGFFEARCDLYNLYPLLVHVRLFGGHYVASVDTTLKRFGY